jgi:hypothetical protein
MITKKKLLKRIEELESDLYGFDPLKPANGWGGVTRINAYDFAKANHDIIAAILNYLRFDLGYEDRYILIKKKKEKNEEANTQTD